MDGLDCSHSPISSGDPKPGVSAVADPMPPYWSFKRSFMATADPSPPTRTAAVAPAMSGFFSDEEPRHFLDSCFLCKKPLAINRDIFMYRGDTPFCSVECRQEQIEIDEAEEKKAALKHQIPVKHKEKSPKIRARAAGTVVAG